ncbi:phage integrase N-terminal SAM-like domain-containing protein [Mesorhizobium silamurunense]|uniref:phage integrase N-terminal SAM-like domain-containing protein n=1 Tax=Mesorhizobium silamurunense TaxID=499528 RepID=UPI001FEEEAAC|nr:phage integrase N-terminal SAM-like domain-containing protein [Mesorhizobium silamurunense]
MATLSTDAPITPLRQRMQQDMLMRGLGPHTQQDYVRHVRRFAAFLGRAPDTATTEDIRRFQLSQHENGMGPPDQRRPKPFSMSDVEITGADLHELTSQADTQDFPCAVS